MTRAGLTDSILLLSSVSTFPSAPQSGSAEDYRCHQFSSTPHLSLQCCKVRFFRSNFNEIHNHKMFSTYENNLWNKKQKDLMRGNKILLGTNISENQIKSSLDLAGWGIVSKIFQIILVFNLIYYTVTHIAFFHGMILWL